MRRDLQDLNLTPHPSLPGYGIYLSFLLVMVSSWHGFLREPGRLDIGCGGKGEKHLLGMAKSNPALDH